MGNFWGDFTRNDRLEQTTAPVARKTRILSNEAEQTVHQHDEVQALEVAGLCELRRGGVFDFCAKRLPKQGLPFRTFWVVFAKKKIQKTFKRHFGKKLDFLSILC